MESDKTDEVQFPRVYKEYTIANVWPFPFVALYFQVH